MYVPQTNSFAKRSENLGYRLKNDPESIAKILTYYEIEFVLKESKGYFVVPCPICHREKYGDKCSLKESCVRTEQDCVDLTAQIRFVFREPNYRVNWRCFRQYDHAFKFYNSMVGYIAACFNGSSYNQILNTIEKLLDDNDLLDDVIIIKDDVANNTTMNITHTNNTIITNNTPNTHNHLLTTKQQQLYNESHKTLTAKQLNTIDELTAEFGEDAGLFELHAMLQNNKD